MAGVEDLPGQLSDEEKKVTPESEPSNVEEGRILHHAENADTAMKYAHNWHEFDKVTPEMERRLKLKADLYVTPLLALIYALQFADKVSNGGASVMGMRQDLDMEDNRYSWVGVSFYLGEIVGLLFVWTLIQRFPAAKMTASLIIMWGIIMACSAASQSFGGYIACRVLLGMCESVVTPAFSLVTTQWYRRDAGEQFSRTNFWFGANGIGTIIGTSLAYGFYIRKSSSIDAWRGLFICLGCLTIVVGVVFLLHIPDDPTKAWFLSEDEKMWQIERIRKNNKGFGSHRVKLYQAVECLRDPRWYLYMAIMFLGSIPNGGLTNFGTITIEGIIENNGAKPVQAGNPDPDDVSAQSLLMQLPQGGTEFVGCFLVGLLSIFILKNYRMAYGVFFSLINVLALCLLSWGPNAGSKLFGLYAFAWVAPVVMIAVLSSIQSNTGGTTKTLVTTATFMQFYCGGNALGSSSAVFKSSEEPEYKTAKIVMAACVCAEAFLVVCLFFVNYLSNRLRDKKNEKLPPMDHPEFADLTDMENPEFRYAY